jgi:hypothetical protein
VHASGVHQGNEENGECCPAPCARPHPALFAFQDRPLWLQCAPQQKLDMNATSNKWIYSLDAKKGTIP